MAGTVTPSDEAWFLNAYYSAWSSRWLDQAPLQKAVSGAPRVLWIGSYFDLAARFTSRDWVILDLNIEMLAIGRNRLGSVSAVQGDIRKLPFAASFDTVVALGAVTAYLLVDTFVELAACELRSALMGAPSSRLLIDAYDINTIHSTSYFNGRGEWQFGQSRFSHIVETQRVPNRDGVFAASLEITKEGEAGGDTKRFQFYQRAFASDHLAGLFENQGLHLVDCHADPVRGRIYHIYASA